MTEEVGDTLVSGDSVGPDGLTLEETVEILCSILTDPRTPGEIVVQGVATLVNAADCAAFQNSQSSSEDTPIEAVTTVGSGRL